MSENPSNGIGVPPIPIPTSRSARSSHRDDPVPKPRPFHQFLRQFERSIGRFPAIPALGMIAIIAGVLQIAGTLSGDDISALSGIIAIVDPSTLGYPDSASSRLMTAIGSACITAMAPSVIAQLIAERRNLIRPIVPQIITAAVVVLLGICLDLLPPIDSGVGRIWGITKPGILLFCLALMFWELYTAENEDDLPAWMLKGAIFAFFSAGILNAGLAVCLLALDTLVVDLGYHVQEIVLMVCWYLIFPMVFCSQIPRRDEALSTSKAYRIIIGFIIFPVSMVLLVVLYIYIFQIIFTRTFPSGQMNWFGSITLLVALGLWVGMRMLDNPITRWYVRWGWLLVVPVLVVQTMAVVIRISAYGLTSARYAGLLCLGVGVAGLLLAALDKRPGTLFAFAAIAVVIGCLTPASIIDVPYITQASRLENALERNGMTDAGDITAEELAQTGQDDPEAMQTIVDSWTYLQSHRGGYLFSGFTEDIRAADEQIGFSGFVEQSRLEYPAPLPGDEPGYVNPRTFVTYRTSPDAAMDVAGYEKAYLVDYAAVDSTTFEFDDTTPDGKGVTCDLGPMLELLEETYGDRIDDGETHLDVHPQELTVECEDGSRLTITSMDITYTSDGSLSEVYVTGWLLTRDG